MIGLVDLLSVTLLAMLLLSSVLVFEMLILTELVVDVPFCLQLLILLIVVFVSVVAYPVVLAGGRFEKNISPCCDSMHIFYFGIPTSFCTEVEFCVRKGSWSRSCILRFC